MAVLASIATGNFTNAATWGIIDSTSYLNAENATESLLTTSYAGTRSSAFTPGAITISHIGVKLCERLGTTGTISVCLELDAGDILVTGTEVTIDVADLPNALETDANGGWIFFKLSSPVLLLAATAYQVAAKTSSANMVDLWCDGTADNLSRALITTSTASPSAGDDLIVAGEKTGSGTSNNFTVTMDETVATDYGSNTTSNVTPSLAICSGGTLQYGTTVATNYVLRQSGHVIVYSGGTLNMGTTGTPMPRNSSAILEFDCGSDGSFGLIIRNGGTWSAQGLSRTSGKDVWYALLNTDEAAAQTTLGLDTDTGWLSGDEIAIASTTRSAQGEKRTLNADAGASSVVVTSGLTNAHSGTSPTQAEVMLLTRNVKIRAVTSTLVTFISVKQASSVDLDWVEFYYLGENATDKRGVNIETTTGSFSMVKCSVHDCEDYGIYVTGSTANNVVIQNCALYSIGTANTQAAISVASATSGTSITIDNNIIISVTGVGISLGDLGITVSNNRITGASSYGMDLAESYPSVWGTMSGNIIHSNQSFGINANATGFSDFLILNTTIWRNNNSGISINTGVAMCVTNGSFDGLTMFGNNGSNILLATASSILDVTFKDFTSNGDSTFATTSGIRIEFGGRPSIIKLDNCDFSTASGIKTAHTNDINVNASNSIVRVEANNCKFGAATEFNNFPANVLNGSYIRSSRHDQTSGSHKSLYKFGTSQSNSITYKTAAPSEELLPLSATVKFSSATKRVAVANGQTITISVWVRKDSSYNGNAPRIKVKRNAGLGITSDTILDTLTVGVDTWEQLTGTTATVSDDGILEFEVDCDGTAGSIFVDDWSVT